MKKYILGDFEVNTYLLTNKGFCYIIDPGYISNDLIEDVKKYKLLGVILTHGHLDHIDAIENFNCPIYIHKNDLICLKDERYSCYYLSNKRRSYKLENLDIKILDDHSILDFADEKIEVIYTPGHTNGSICLKYKDKLFSGDTLFKGSIGRTDLYGGSYKALSENISSKIFTLPDNTIVYCGHGPTTTIGYEKEYNPYL
jgi:glyoxylase-like metal-dependent hydrolase (beta-lactamase superfamily II)